MNQHSFRHYFLFGLFGSNVRKNSSLKKQHLSTVRCSSVGILSSTDLKIKLLTSNINMTILLTTTTNKVSSQNLKNSNQNFDEQQLTKKNGWTIKIERRRRKNWKRRCQSQAELRCDFRVVPFESKVFIEIFKGSIVIQLSSRSMKTKRNTNKI